MNWFIYGVGFDIRRLLFVMASFDLSNLGGQMENHKFYCGSSWKEGKILLSVPLSENVNFDYLRY